MFRVIEGEQSRALSDWPRKRRAVAPARTQRVPERSGWEKQLGETLGRLVDALKRSDEEAERIVKEALKTFLRSKLD